MKTPASWARTFTVALGIASMAAWGASSAEPGPDMPPSGSLNVLGPVPAFEPNALPLDWMSEGKIERGQLAVVEKAGIPALRVINGKNQFVTAKPTQASLLATPYLSWSWNMEPPESGVHPVRLVIGLHRVDAAPSGWESLTSAGPLNTLPPHDRAIVILWGDSALQRGSIAKPETIDSKQTAARYTARGGSENTGSWWFETIDLSDIYRRTWPQDKIENARIIFIGIAAAGGKAPSPAYISGLRLSR